ncbi:flagellar protein FliS [Polynucleobacter sp. SHI8]|uniref:flagellar export chaperone FliS n=1 Tax=unclassified Polynucleobacter TaxID=2640945 RepID=UPI0024909B01|nr:MULTISPECIES: flagellar export chaperone FliS [unclassified Polynucleobacter]BDW11749.1 flagellar protein FliS [Polynucleobacter sp. SHI2]BDW14196.1 flagellar protein FliS [Polynucleobacter sp. SHI8]
MFNTYKNPAKAYASTNIESNAIAGNPHKLIAMLYEGALIAILQAEHHMKKNNVMEKSAAISKASDIILMGLDASLNMEEGGEIGQNLHALYSYMCQQLIMCNLHNDVNKLKEIYALLLELKNTWDAIAPRAESKSLSANAFAAGSAPQTSTFTPASA